MTERDHLKLNRRSFLCSIIGTVIAVPFLARLESEDWQRVLLPYRVLFKEEQAGCRLQGTAIEKIEEMPDGFKFVAEPLKATRSMIISSYVMLTEGGIVVSEGRFDQIFHLHPGDSLLLTNRIQQNSGMKMSLEEIVNMKIRQNKGL